MTSSPVLALIVWAALATWLGQLAGQRLGLKHPSLGERLVLGLLLLHAWMMLLDAFGVPWTRASLLAPALLGVLAHWLDGGSGVREHATRAGALAVDRLSVVADAVGLAAVAAFAYCAWTLRALAPDFIYHWGLKGRQAAAQAGIDWPLLQGHDASYLHPDYPLLVPSLYGATDILAGAWHEPTLMLWSVVFLGLLVLECRRASEDLIGGSYGRIAWATAALVLAGFSIGHLQAGAADIPFALAVLALARQLWCLHTTRDDQIWIRVGVWTAFAVVCKIEGFPLAAFALGLAWLRSEDLDPAGGLPGWLRRRWVAWVPAAVLGGWWLLTMGARDLYQASNSGWPTWERVRLTAQALPTALSAPSWSGLAWLLPLLFVGLFVRRVRWFVVLPCLQVAFYLSSYVGGEQSTTFWVISSFPRLVFHVMPVLWLATLAVLAGCVASESRRAAKVPSA